MPPAYYESDRALSEYLLFHYGSEQEVLPGGIGPGDAVGFAIRCVTECVDRSIVPSGAVALDLGCAVGRSSFELARFCDRVVGIDRSRRFIEAAREIQARGALRFGCADEGELQFEALARAPEGVDRSRVRFEEGDALNLRAGLGPFDIVLLANLIDRLANPRLCLAQLDPLLNPRGQLVIVSPYTWLEEYTPRENWLGGFLKEGRSFKTLDGLREILTGSFELRGTKELPFLIREHSRKFQWGLAEASCWVRK